MATRRHLILELFASMRFAISLLTIIAIASMLGTVLKQNEPYSSYLNQFGPFWFPIFERLGLFSVYNAGWFLVILTFLVMSTSICIWRNSPKMLREMRAFRDDIREQALRNFGHRDEWQSATPAAVLVERAGAYLHGHRYAVRTRTTEAGTLIAAKAGGTRRLGYILAHTGIVVICVGGLLDSEMSLRLKLALGEKSLLRGSIARDAIPPQGRLDADNWSFRGNLLVAEGGSSDIAVLNVADGVLIQDLPFSIELKRFLIEHYSTGQPKLFASEVTVRDKQTGHTFDHRIEVNHPLIYRGIAVYQASFDDGGTKLNLRATDLHRGDATPLLLDGRVGESAKIRYQNNEYTIEFTGFRPFNIENLGSNTGEGESPEPSRSWLERLGSEMGAGARPDRAKNMRNVGASFQYKLRDAAGQAREYTNYMLPVQIDGRWYFISGMRESPNEPFRYLRMPLDDDVTFDGFLELRATLLDRNMFAAIGKQFAGANSDAAMAQGTRDRLEETVRRVLETFNVQGMRSVAEFLEKAVPEGEREKAADIYLRLLQGAAWEAWQLGRERAGKERLAPSVERARFVQDALNALSDSFLYGIPLYVQLLTYEEVKASVFQLTRSPGRNIVYLGCLALVLGIFAMLYIRERRIWTLIRNDGSMLMAMSSNRRTIDLDREFMQHQTGLRAMAGASAHT